MRICISSLPLDTFGGAERVVVNEAQHFSERGHDVHLLTEAVRPELLSAYGLTEPVGIHTFTAETGIVQPEVVVRARRTRRLLRSLRPDVVVAHYRQKSTWLALSTLGFDPVFTTHVHGSLFWFQDRLSRLVHMGKPCARAIVDNVPGHTEFWTHDDTMPALERLWITGDETLNAFALRASSTVFVNTHQVARELDCLYGVDAEVVPPGIEADWGNGRDDLTLPTAKPFVLSVSRLDSRKRIDLLVRAFRELRSERDDVDLVVGGTGNEEANLRRLVDDAGLGEAVHFVGHVPEAELPSYYRAAEVFASPGWMSYGLTPLEAIRCDTKVAISSDAFVKEVIGDEPGVMVLEPTVDAWESGLRRLLDSDVAPSPDVVPTSEAHAAAKLATFERSL